MKSNQTSEKEIIKAIERGDFRHHYIAYNRKSLDEPDSQKNSLAYQKAEITRLSQRELLPIANFTLKGFCKDGMVSEKHSSFKENEDLSISEDGRVQYQIERPKFQRLMHHLSQSHFKGVVCLCWDRISRNRGDDTVVRKLMKRGVDVRFAYATYDNSSSGELHMDVDGMFAQHHSRVTSEKVKKTTGELRSKGICTYRAPIGYLNPGTMDHKPHDPERAPIITEMFKLYATGDWSHADLSRYANEVGLKTVPMRPRRTREEILADEGDDEDNRKKVTHPISKNHVTTILSNQFYTGKIIGSDGIYVPSNSHDGLIDDDTFNRVQELLTKKNVSTHYTKKIDHPLRGMVRCGGCNRVYTPYSKRGHLYFYARCTDDCENTVKSINLEFITGEIRKLIAKLHFTDDELGEFNARTGTDLVLLEQKRDVEFDRIERQKTRIRSDLAYLRKERLQLLKTGAYSPQNLVSEQRKLEAKLDDLCTSEQISEEAMRGIIEDVVLLSELLKTALPLYDLAKPDQKETIIKIIFSELFVSENTLTYKAQKGFEPLIDRISDLCPPTQWVSEHIHEHPQVRDVIEKLKRSLPLSGQ